MPTMFLERDRGTPYGDGSGGGVSSERCARPGFSISQDFLSHIRNLSMQMPGFPEVGLEDIHVVPIVYHGHNIDRELEQAVVVARPDRFISSPDARLVMNEGEIGEVSLDFSRIIHHPPGQLKLFPTAGYDDVFGYAYDFQTGNDESLTISAEEGSVRPRYRLCIFVPPDPQGKNSVPVLISLLTTSDDLTIVPPDARRQSSLPNVSQPPATAVPSKSDASTRNSVSDLARGLRKDSDVYEAIEKIVGDFSSTDHNFSPLPFVDRVAFLRDSGTPVGIMIDRGRNEIRFEFMNFDVYSFLRSRNRTISSLLQSFKPSINNWITMVVAKNGLVRAWVNGTSQSEDITVLQKQLSNSRVFAHLFLTLQKEGTIHAPETAPRLPILPVRAETQLKPPFPPGTQQNRGREVRELMTLWRGKVRGHKGERGRRRHR